MKVHRKLASLPLAVSPLLMAADRSCVQEPPVDSIVARSPIPVSGFDNFPAVDLADPAADRFNRGLFVMDAGPSVETFARFGFRSPTDTQEVLARFNRFNASYLEILHPKPWRGWARGERGGQAARTRVTARAGRHLLLGAGPPISCRSILRG